MTATTKIPVPYVTAWSEPHALAFRYHPEAGGLRQLRVTR
jgi:hypothetical protein